MAEFEAKVYRIEIEEHPNADALELARVGNYRAIVGKGAYKSGDYAVYIPEQAVLPEWVIQKLNLVGRLAGKAKNRVKAIKLRGVLSQGLIYPLEFIDDGIWMIETLQENGRVLIQVQEGDVVTEELGLVKYEPEIPASMSGDLFNASGHTLKYDIENIKKYPDVLQAGEGVAITEKIHGTWACFGWNPAVNETDGVVIASKGLSARGLAFKLNEKNKTSNLYVRTLEESRVNDSEGLTFVDRVRMYIDDLFSFNNRLPFYVLGEIYGKGVQDLHYGTQKPKFRVFDVFVGAPGLGRYLNVDELSRLTDELDLETVPMLWQGEYSPDVVESLTTGTTIAGDVIGSHIREGVVVKPLFEREDDEIGRVILKSVSEDYLLRKGGTEYN